jgi:hypothetical protein
MFPSDVYKGNNKHDYIYQSPLRFIDSLSNCSNRHIVLYYENREYGQKIQFKFIKDGLLKGENCIYFTHEINIALIENEMIGHDIDVETYYKKGLMHIYKIPDLFNHPKGVLKGTDEFMNEIFSGLRPPFRLVGRTVDEIETKEQIEANLAMEKKFHSNIDQFNGHVLCTYDVNKSPSNTHGKWVEGILNSHNSAIFVTETTTQGLAFDMA